MLRFLAFLFCLLINKHCNCLPKDLCEDSASVKELKQQVETLQLKLHGLEERLQNNIAFTAFREEQTWYDSGSTIVFNTALTSVGGGFDTGSGTFTCPVTGLYLFSVTTTCTNEAYLRLQLQSGSTVYGGIYCDRDDADTGSNTIVMECTSGQTLSVVNTSSGRWLGGRENSFTGVLVSI